MTRSYRIGSGEHQDFLAIFESLARDFGTRLPRGRARIDHPPVPVSWDPILSDNLFPKIAYGYGDPAVLRIGDYDGDREYYLLATSNDAPDAFPILHSRDLKRWTLRSFVFPEGKMPAWAASGPGKGDYWAPELHDIGTGGGEGDFLLCFSAREEGGGLAIGLARSSHPEGPFVTADEPFLRGGVIDPHIFLETDGTAYLLWKEDANGRWPAALAALLAREPELIARLFAEDCDRCTAVLAAACSPWAATLSSMQRFFLFQPLIEAVVDRFAAVRHGLESSGAPEAAAVLEAMRTPIYIQQLDTKKLALVGERRIILVNDLAWEGHLIEGPWLTRQQDRYWLFYAGNDFSTSDYGIGVAAAEHLFGPYRKRPEPLLRSSAEWVGPGHPSVAMGPDGTPRLFFHAFRPGELGYKAFRAFLSARLRFDGDHVDLLGTA